MYSPNQSETSKLIHYVVCVTVKRFIPEEVTV